MLEPDGSYNYPLDYHIDLNPIHAAILSACEVGGYEFQAMFQLRLQEAVQRTRRDLNREQIGFWMNNADAAQRCEALLKAVGKWEAA